MQAISQFSTANSRLIPLGLILFFISASLFICMEAFLDQRVDGSVFFLFFVAHFAIFWIYFGLLLSDNKQHTGSRFRFYNIRHNSLLFLLFNVSAYALNRLIPVFNESAFWLIIFLILINVALLLFAIHHEQMPEWMHQLILPILGAALLFQLYQSLYVMPIYGLSVMTFWFFGLSLHIFVPLLWVLLLSRILYLYHQKSSAYSFFATAGMAISLGMTLVFTQKISQINREVSLQLQQQQSNLGLQEWPAWVRLSQHLPANWMTERVLKAGIQYAQYQPGRFWGGIDRAFDGFGENAMHDPLIFLATVFSGQPNISTEDRLRMLKAIYDKRHEAERKVWSGKNLRTTDIKTEIQCFPTYRIAYTEKTIQIENELRTTSRWGNTQEALYSFFVPEGAVVTSASLWVEGVERPAWLTTKTKAEQAYSTIVGQERRDPLLVHWQEGNRITARIFPCSPEKPRTFKIGFTTPLHYDNGQLIYENIDFVGPDWQSAREVIHLLGVDKSAQMYSPLSFTRVDNRYVYEGIYQSQWSLSMEAPPLSKQGFSFQGRAFHLEPISPKLEPFDPEKVYLDLNASWSRAEFQDVWACLKGKKVYAYTQQVETLTEANADQIFEASQQKNFSLFPIYYIEDPARSLLISKSDRLTPTLSDLEGSSMGIQLTNYLMDLHQPIRMYHLGEVQSPYLQMLAQLRGIQVVPGSIEPLLKWIESKQFPPLPESEQVIAIPPAKMQIVVDKDMKQQAVAPDHLMRLFVYNDLMKRIGKGYFDKKKLEQVLLDQTKEAHILTPVSSLLVLETDSDYERFDIRKSKNTLGNAKIAADGAVPEPHEWLLIIFAFVFAVSLYRQKG